MLYFYKTVHFASKSLKTFLSPSEITSHIQSYQALMPTHILSANMSTHVHFPSMLLSIHTGNLLCTQWLLFQDNSNVMTTWSLHSQKWRLLLHYYDTLDNLIHLVKFLRKKAISFWLISYLWFLVRLSYIIIIFVRFLCIYELLFKYFML